jgi:peptidoglycan-associated lipoprotein
MSKKFLYVLCGFLITSVSLFGCVTSSVDDDEYDDGDMEEVIIVEEIDEASFAQEPSIRSGAETSVSELRAIHFDFDSNSLTQEARRILQNNVDYLTANPDINIIVEGHCDDRGTVAYNLALGQRRAVRVKEYYVQLGIAPERVATISYGEEQPIEFGENEMAWAANRRAESKIIK